jgi:hypothetical protein
MQPSSSTSIQEISASSPPEVCPDRNLPFRSGLVRLDNGFPHPVLWRRPIHGHSARGLTITGSFNPSNQRVCYRFTDRQERGNLMKQSVRGAVPPLLSNVP